MKRKNSKIRLARETVRSMSETQLGQARGGWGSMIAGVCSSVYESACPCFTGEEGACGGYTDYYSFDGRCFYTTQC